MNTQLFRTSADISLRNPAELIAAVPFLLGYPPENSIVLIGLNDARITVTGRISLPDATTSLDGFTTIVRTLRNNDACAAVVIGFGPADRVTRCVDRLRDAIAELGVDLVDALRVHDDRYWSYLCDDLDCCPADGHRLIGDTTAIAAEFTAAGAQVKPDRQAVERELDPVSGRDRESMAAATERVIEVLGYPVDDRLLRDRGRTILARCADTLDLPGHEDTAWLAVALSDEAILDEAMMSIDQHPPECDATALWMWLTRHCEPDQRPLCAALLAYAAWRCGNGALAGDAARVAAEADPRHQLTEAMLQILDNGVPPWATMEP